MCQAPHQKRRVVDSVPASCAAPLNIDDDNDNAFSKSVSGEEASLPSPCAAPPNGDNNDNNAFSKSVLDVDSLHAEGLVIDIAGIAADDRGCQFKEHRVCCDDVNADIVVRLRRKEILGKGNMREDTAITVNWVTNGFEQCHVGFPRLLCRL